MGIITDITEQKRDASRVSIYIDGRFYGGMKLKTALLNRLKKGAEIEEEELLRIMEESDREEAVDRASSYLGRAIKTSRQVYDYLLSKGYAEKICAETVQKFVEYGYIDDGEYCRLYIENYSGKKGKRALRAELYKRGISSDIIEESLKGVSESDAAIEAAEKYMRGKEQTRENLQKAKRYLLNKGFEYEEADRALREIAEAGGEEEEND